MIFWCYTFIIQCSEKDKLFVQFLGDVNQNILH